MASPLFLLMLPDCRAAMPPRQRSTARAHARYAQRPQEACRADASDVAPPVQRARQEREVLREMTRGAAPRARR